ncbi:MAG: glycosyl hydrolase [Bacteroidia bacterium]|nr:MAG: glycosyl hydrolase [Bacteroidia bacterium]
MKATKAKKPTYHIVSHSHWDREWYFPFDRFRAMLVEMIEDLLGMFQKDRGFRSYTLDGQLAAVLDYLEIRPDRRKTIAKLIKQKKLFIGPWYILQDEFLAGGEGQIRNLLLGMRYGKDLGGVMKIGYIPDQFAHIAQMPQILRGFGLDTAMFYRGFGGEPGQEPSEYWWIGPDGSKVLLHHMPKDGYSAGYFGTQDEGVVIGKFRRMQKELDERSTTSQRLFFNGGDHHWPDEAVTGAIQILRKRLGVNVVHSSFPEFFSRLRREIKPSKLPVLNGETRFGYRHAFVVQGGVYSSRMYLKQMNAAGENLLERMVDPLNVFAMMMGARSITAQIEQAWKYVIQNHDHDAICGTSTDEVHREMVSRYEKAKNIGAFALQESLNALLPYDEKAKGDDRFLFVFNPSPMTRTEVVEAHVDFTLQDVVVGLNPEVHVAPKLAGPKSFRLEDSGGKPVPYHVLERKETFGIVYSKHDYPSQILVDRWRIIMNAEEIPALGWKGYRVIRDVPPFVESRDGLSAGHNYLENKYLRIEVHPDGSWSLTDKTTGVRYGPLNSFEDSGDVGDEYNYSYPKHDTMVDSSGGNAKITVIEANPLRVSLKIGIVLRVPVSATPDEQGRSGELVDLPLTTTLMLTPDARRVEVKTEIENTARDHRLRAIFRTGVDTVESFAETPFAVVHRTHREYDVQEFPYEHPALVAPMKRFVSLRDGRKGLTLLARGLPEYELGVRERGKLSLTLLRCVGKLSGRNLLTRPGGAAGWWTETPEAQCLGRHVFEYALVPHGGEEDVFWPVVLREAEFYTVTPFTVNRKNDQTVLDRSWFSVEGNIQLSTIKEAEAGSGVIVRVYNPVGQPVQGVLTSYLPVRSAVLCRLDESPLKPVRVMKRRTIRLRLRPFEIATVRLDVETPKPKK